MTQGDPVHAYKCVGGTNNKNLHTILLIDAYYTI